MPKASDDAWLRSAAASDATKVEHPVVLPGSPPRLDLSRVSPQAMAAIQPVSQALGIRDPENQLKFSTSVLDLIPSALGATADLTSGGVAKATGLSGIFAALGEPVREAGYEGLGQSHMIGEMDPKSILERMLRVGGGQSLATLTGRGVAGAQRAFGRLPDDLTAGAYAGLPAKVAKPGILETAQRERVMPGPPLKFEGSQRADELFTASHAAEDATVRRIVQSAKPPVADLGELWSRAVDKVKTKIGRGLTADQQTQLAAARANGDPSTRGLAGADEVLTVKRSYDNRSRPGYLKIESGTPIPVTDIELQLNKAYADEARAWLRDNVPGLGRQMQRTKEIIELRPAIRYAERQPITASREGAFATARDLSLTRERMGKAALAVGPYARTFGNRGAVIFGSQLPRMVGGKLVSELDKKKEKK